MATWTPAKTWSVDEILTADDLNTYVRDNTTALHDRPADSVVTDGSGNQTTTSTSFVDVTGVEVTIEVSGHVMIGFNGMLGTSVIGGWVHLDIEIDGVRVGEDDGIAGAKTSAGSRTPVSFTWLSDELDPGSHDIKLQWKVSSGTGTLYSDNGTADNGWKAQFWVHEQ